MSSRSIAMITSGLGAGGSEIQFIQLALGLRSRGWRVEVISLQAGGGYWEVLCGKGVPVRLCRASRLPTPGAVWRLVRAIREVRPSVVHTQAFRANLAGRLAAAMVGIPVVASVRATYSYLPRAYRPFERMLCSWTSYVVTPCEATGRYLVEVIGIPARKVVTIVNGVDTALFSPDRNGLPFRERWKLGQGFVVLAPGRLVAQKNHAAVLRAFRTVAASRPDARLVVAGEGPLRRELEGQARLLGGAVVFTGELSRAEMAEAMAAADVVCVLSRYEGMPNVVLEAMASGRPVVANCVDGVPEVVEDRVDGILVPPGDEIAAARALESLAASPGQRRALGQAGRRKVVERYGIDTNVARHVELYESLL